MISATKRLYSTSLTDEPSMQRSLAAYPILPGGFRRAHSLIILQGKFSPPERADAEKIINKCMRPIPFTKSDYHIISYYYHINPTRLRPRLGLRQCQRKTHPSPSIIIRTQKRRCKEKCKKKNLPPSRRRHRRRIRRRRRTHHHILHSRTPPHIPETSNCTTTPPVAAVPSRHYKRDPKKNSTRARRPR